MTANLTIYTLELNDIFAVPLKAFRFQPQMPEKGDKLPEPVGLENPGKYTLWVARDGKLIETNVEAGVANSVERQVLSGVKKGDRVALQYVTKSEKEDEENTQQNPFMPKRPGAGKKR